MSDIENFLYYLAKKKYNLYKSLYVDHPFAQREQECLDRLKSVYTYSTILEVIAMLPAEEQLALEEIEKEYFNDVPYVTKVH